MILLAANSDQQTILDVSTQLGFLTGDETQEMKSGLYPFENKLLYFMLYVYLI